MHERRENATDGTKATDAKHPFPPSHLSHSERLIPPHGGYEKLFSYPKTEIIYDASVRFCDRFIDLRSRTHDQMVQAARGGNKNIAEGAPAHGPERGDGPTTAAVRDLRARIKATRLMGDLGSLKRKLLRSRRFVQITRT